MPTDRQSRAFRDARPEDRVLDDDLLGHVGVVHHAADGPRGRLGAFPARLGNPFR